MKDNKDEQVNYTHINNCFNQTISEFVFCKRAATYVLKTTLIPLNSTPSTRLTATDRLQTMNHRGLSHSDCQVGAWDFFSGQTVRKLGKLVPCEGSQQHALPIWKVEFYISKFIDNFDILFQTRVKYVAAKSSPLVCTAHISLRA